jgi:hypothetical protein
MLRVARLHGALIGRGLFWTACACGNGRRPVGTADGLWRTAGGLWRTAGGLWAHTIVSPASGA